MTVQVALTSGPRTEKLVAQVSSANWVSSKKCSDVAWCLRVNSGRPGWERVWGRMDTRICVAESVVCSPELSGGEAPSHIGADPRLGSAGAHTGPEWSSDLKEEPQLSHQGSTEDW